MPLCRAILLAILLPLLAAADTFELKDGTQINGTLVRVGAEGAVVRSDGTELTLEWGFFAPDKAVALWEGQLEKLDADGCAAFAEFAKKAGLADKAKEGWEAALKKNPDHAAARNGLGFTRENGQWVKAGEKKADQQAGSGSPPPQQAPPPQQPVAARPKTDNLRPPEGTPQAAIENDAKGNLLLEEAKKQRGDAIDTVEKAIKELEKAARTPKFALPQYHLGIAYQYTKEYDDAQSALEKALKINPDFFEAMVELGDTYSWLKKNDKAIEQYDRAIAIAPDYALAYREKGIVLIRQRKVQEAREALAKSVALDKTDQAADQILKMVDNDLKGPGWKSTYQAEGEHFVVTTDDSQDTADLLLKHVEIVYTLYTKIFPEAEKEAIKFPVLVFKDAKDYQAYGGPPNTGGYYNPMMRNLVFFKQAKLSDTLLVLYHEAFHQYLAYYLEDAPQWYNEGHGDYFGPSEYVEKSKMMYIRVNPWRLGLIQGAIKANRYQPLDKLMLMTQDELYDPQTIGLNYAESWSFVYFLWQYKSGAYAPILKAYFKKLREGAGLKKAYTATFGRSPMKQIEQEWKDFITGLK